MQLQIWGSRHENFITKEPDVTITKDTFTREQFEVAVRSLQ